MDVIVPYFFGALLAAIATSGLLLWRWKDKFPSLPDWTWRNILALMAMVGTILGAAILTAAAWWLLDQLLGLARALITELTRDPKARPEVGTALNTIIDGIVWGLKLLLAGVIVVMLSLGIAITPRKIVVNRTGAELSGGDDDPPPIPVKVVNPAEEPVPTTDQPEMNP